MYEVFECEKYEKNQALSLNLRADSNLPILNFRFLFKLNRDPLLRNKPLRISGKKSHSKAGLANCRYNQADSSNSLRFKLGLGKTEAKLWQKNRQNCGNFPFLHATSHSDPPFYRLVNVFLANFSLLCFIISY